MTMMQKVQAKRSKKGFTLVELVIVIAILAILAAVAIPVITTTIKSAKLSTMESNAATLNMLVKEAINCSKAKITATVWNKEEKGDENNYKTATVDDVAIENDLYTATQRDDANNFDFYKQYIQGDPYGIGWDDTTHNIVVWGKGYDHADDLGDPSGKPITELEPSET